LGGARLVGRRQAAKGCNVLVELALGRLRHLCDRLVQRQVGIVALGARVDVAPYKRDPMDFVLWKPSKPNEPSWQSPARIAAPGRPGWHIECSAMSMATLLEPFGGGLQCDDPNRNVFDIHGGGIDLVFPHHENEIAQSCSAFHSARMANFWLHNGFLQVEGEKMAKSLGNFVTIHELLETPTFGGRKWSGEALRLAMLRGHYRQPLDWTAKALAEAEATLDRWYDAVGEVEARGDPDQDVLNALADDLNTPEAIARLHRLAHPAVAEAEIIDVLESRRTLAPGLFKRSANLLGLLGQTRSERLASVLRGARIDAAKIEAIVAERAAARTARNWAESDRLRDELADLGVAVKDNKDGTTTWEPKR
jgi:cysteinyl-tRNA synthetase